jgi:molybdopterin-binding aldehyde dehydrogenase-like protein
MDSNLQFPNRSAPAFETAVPSHMNVSRPGTESSNPSPSSGESVSRYEVASFSPEVPNFPNGCHVCEVEIDPETGTTRVLRYVVVDDVGTVINPLTLAGQIHGGVVQGIGQAFTEHLVYDERSGQLLTGSFMDYGLPRADEVCSRHAIFCARRTRAFCISERRAKKPSEQNGCSGGISKLILNDICKKQKSFVFAKLAIYFPLSSKRLVKSEIEAISYWI